MDRGGAPEIRNTGGGESSSRLRDHAFVLDMLNCPLEPISYRYVCLQLQERDLCFGIQKFVEDSCAGEANLWWFKKCVGGKEGETPTRGYSSEKWT